MKTKLIFLLCLIGLGSTTVVSQTVLAAPFGVSNGVFKKYQKSPFQLKKVKNVLREHNNFYRGIKVVSNKRQFQDETKTCFIAYGERDTTFVRLRFDFDRPYKRAEYLTIKKDTTICLIDPAILVADFIFIKSGLVEIVVTGSSSKEDTFSAWTKKVGQNLPKNMDCYIWQSVMAIHSCFGLTLQKKFFSSEKNNLIFYELIDEFYSGNKGEEFRQIKNEDGSFLILQIVYPWRLKIFNPVKDTKIIDGMYNYMPEII